MINIFKSHGCSKSIAALKKISWLQTFTSVYHTSELTPMNRVYKYRKWNGLLRGARADRAFKLISFAAPKSQR